jgi:hypothetical protein
MQMTVIANSVNLLLGLLGNNRALQIMAVATVFIAMAVDTLETKEINVLFVLKGDNRRRLVRCVVDSRYGDVDHRVGSPEDIRGISAVCCQILTWQGKMTDEALGIMTPLSMT